METIGKDFRKPSIFALQILTLHQRHTSKTNLDFQTPFSQASKLLPQTQLMTLLSISLRGKRSSQAESNCTLPSPPLPILVHLGPWSLASLLTVKVGVWVCIGDRGKGGRGMEGERERRWEDKNAQGKEIRNLIISTMLQKSIKMIWHSINCHAYQVNIYKLLCDGASFACFVT